MKKIVSVLFLAILLAQGATAQQKFCTPDLSQLLNFFGDEIKNSTITRFGYVTPGKLSAKVMINNKGKDIRIYVIPEWHPNGVKKTEVYMTIVNGMTPSRSCDQVQFIVDTALRELKK